MKTLESSALETYRWWHDAGIDPAHASILEGHAIEIMRECREEGLCEGELLYEIEGIEYRGYWEITSVGSKARASSAFSDKNGGHDK